MGRAYTTPEASDAFLRGVKHLWNGTNGANRQARQLYEQALTLDPTYAEAYAALGYTYFTEWWAQWHPDPQPLERAFELAQQTLALDDSSLLAHRLLVLVYAQKGQHEQAIAEAKRLIALVPNWAVGYAELGKMLNFVGRPQDAMKWVEQAMRLDPRSPVEYLWTLGQTYRLMGRYEEAIAAQQKALIRAPNYLPSHIHLASLYAELGREEEARAEAAAILRISPNFSMEGIGQRLPYKDPAVLERFLAALRQAGLK